MYSLTAPSVSLDAYAYTPFVSTAYTGFPPALYSLNPTPDITSAVALSDLTSLTPPLTGVLSTLTTNTGVPVKSIRLLSVLLSTVKLPVELSVPTYPVGTVSV